MSGNVLLGFLPGAREFRTRRYWLALRDSLMFALCLLASAALFDLPSMAAVGLLLVLSEGYQTLHANYRQQCEAALQTYPLEAGSGDLCAVMRLFRRPSWWLPVLNWPWLLIAFIGLAGLALGQSTQVSLSGIIQGLPVAGEFLRGLLHPNWALLHEAVFVYARQTLEVALLGTALGFVLALPVSFFCAQNLMSENLLSKGLYLVCRAIMVVLRSLPTFMLGLIFVALVGLGPFPGVLAISLFSFGVMVKLFSETIETIDYGAVEGIKASGGHWFNAVTFAVIPQAFPGILAQLLYCMEINVHSASVLGLIGAEGIGLPIHEYLSALAYDSAAPFILVTIVMTIVIDYASAFLRRKII
ncbi:phosphonate ABC transporter, permease protein PhnE [Pseudomonas sp. 2FE]|uniref:phosphonate ABC transporter, permease protein PhnE n=1 Tax=Pseudomonas sp. 2FE TaxID=2502190 RepID=UPI001484D8DF|nr:phosphonate ABC transporter, permease protein PhnE [Pseudomonas sp. 2FE]